ncbi:MAG: hypothetical protein KGJ89_01995 [Patescibacteria group bacterium]|nr:hypothetical protein [Patescibacteria group bacterium]MDE2015648.1 hypothetical protein [Patescibacteria group bacterium]MDE2226705.1 hypothetical protein [Patescibacteria group bacterium]
MENNRRELIGIIPLGGDEFANIYRLDLSNPEELTKLKPATWRLSDEEWVLLASIAGVAHAWNHDFQEYVKREIVAERLPANFRPSQCFGEIGLKGFKLVNGDFREFIVYMTNEKWPLHKLGIFGQWFMKSKINPGYAQEIIKEYLED